MGTFHSGYPINITWKIHFHIQLATSPTSLRPSPWTPQLEVPRFDHLDLPSSRTSHLPQLQPPSLGNYITEVGSLQNGPSDPPAFWTHLYGAPDTPPWSLHTLSSGLWSSLASRGPQSGQPSYVPHGGSLPLVLLSKSDSSWTCHSPGLTATGPWITSLCPMLFYYNVDKKKKLLAVQATVYEEFAHSPLVRRVFSMFSNRTHMQSFAHEVNAVSALPSPGECRLVCMALW